jgi:ketosteroid isomerase-like protein
MTSTVERDEAIQALTANGWTPELFQEFWSAPDPKYLRAMVTDDVVGHWPGADDAQGADAYIKALVDLMAALPDITLEVTAGAMNGEVGFVHWKMAATGANGPFVLRGVDCIHMRDGLVCENFINFDSAEFLRLSGLGG